MTTRILGLLVSSGFVLQLVVLAPSSGLSCKKIDACTCQFDDAEGAVVSLRDLVPADDGKPLFQDVPGEDGVFYSYNPCFGFNEGNCTNSSLCELQSINGSSTSLFDHQNVIFGVDEVEKNVQIIYLSPDHLPRTAIVSLECLEGLSPPIFNPFGYQPDTDTYEFQIMSKCACRNACYSRPPPDSRLGAGYVVLIVFFVLVALYLVLGTLHGKMVRQSRGLRMLPNYEFWTGLPDYTKAGCLCVVRFVCCQPKPKGYQDV